jgi:SAM-dependent methyltransferase
MMERNQIIKTIEEYYKARLKQFGPVPQGVDWNGNESQTLRFEQLTKIIHANNDHFSLLDYGCGYGALLDYLAEHKINVQYSGYDISPDMILAAELKHPKAGVTWTSRAADLITYDYVIASGIFNVKEGLGDAAWELYIKETLTQINDLSKKGFAFNILTEYSDPAKKKAHLYYGSPAKLFDYCKTMFAKSVALLHDYPLYEFTILVRKNVL